MKNMKVGSTGFFYPVPKHVPQEKKLDWLINRMAELGCTCMHPGDDTLPQTESEIKRIAELLREKKVELDLGSTPRVFDLVGPDSAEARKILLDRAKLAKALGTNILRTGYGKLTMETSRFNKDISIRSHMDKLVANLKEAAKIVEDNGMVLAVENHCDFTGEEMAQIFSDVGSKSVGCAFDTANGFTVYSDVWREARDLAPWTLTTHIKDFKIIPFIANNMIPFIPVGCTLGEGHVPIPEILDLLEKESPMADGLHLIIEICWIPIQHGADREAQITAVHDESIRYLQNLVNK